jgi:hypothetical protein
MARYKRKPIVVEAVFFAGDDASVKEVCALLESAGFGTKHWEQKEHAQVKLPQRITFRNSETEVGFHIDKGQWVVKKGDEIKILKDEEFKANYVEI